MQFYHSKQLTSVSNVTQAFTTRASGNLAFHVGDNPKIVEKNHALLASQLNYDKTKLIHMKQIHSDVVHVVDEHDNFDNPPTCDALITDKLNTPLMVMVADCSPILFYDSKKKIIAVAHAGRQGAFKNIVKNVIKSFIDNYNSDAKDIFVSIGASIGSCCYEVGSEIYEEAHKLDLKYAIKKKDGNFYLKISKILKSQLLASGINEKNIEISNECNCCKNSKYFSYRADGITGRFCGLISIN